MDQQRIGAFLKQLRKEKMLTQEQLAEHFHVSGRTVSRWENGNNMPDLAVLVELAGYYGVELREILDGERNNGLMKPEERQTFLAMAEYSSEEKSKLLRKMHILFLAGFAGFASALAVLALGLEDTPPYAGIAGLGLGFAFGMIFLGVIFTSRYAAKIQSAKLRLLQTMRKAFAKTFCYRLQ